MCFNMSRKINFCQATFCFCVSQAVVANLLGKHRMCVTLVSKDSCGIKTSKIELLSEEQSRGIELEQYIVSELVKRHEEYA